MRNKGDYIMEQAKQRMWIDPPSGWKYGFPKIWDGGGQLEEWLLEEGYPQREIDSCGEYFFVRQWNVENET